MNRIDQKFQELKSKKQKAFIAYITAGDPSLQLTEELVLAFEKAGVDIIELGIPFSDPMADGTTIQAASQRALNNGMTLAKIFDLVKRLRVKTEIPIALMGYYNPIFSYGDENFIKRCKEIGIDGLIIPDLPPEEAKILCDAAKRADIGTVFFIAPTTTDDRLKANTKASTGFVYYVSLAGVTGTKQAVASDVVKQIKRAKQYTDKPICAGFGITDANQAKAIATYADGIIVGSAIIKKIQEHVGHKDCVEKVSQFVTSLVKAIR